MAAGTLFFEDALVAVEIGEKEVEVEIVVRSRRTAQDTHVALPERSLRGIVICIGSKASKVAVEDIVKALAESIQAPGHFWDTYRMWSSLGLPRPLASPTSILEVITSFGRVVEISPVLQR